MADGKYCSKTKGFTWSRELTIAIIELYEQYPFLYQVTSRQYHNKAARTKAFEDISVELNRRFLTVLGTADVQKKIHGICTQYLTEVRKIKKSRSTGISTDEVYSAKLWCFDRLHFLDEGSQITARGESNLELNIDMIEEETQNSTTEEVIFEGEVEDVVNLSPLEEFPAAEEFLQTPSACQSRSSSASRTSVASAKRRKADQTKIEALLESAQSTLDRITNEPEKRTPTSSGSQLFGDMIAVEMGKIHDEEILDDLKQDILRQVCEAKKRFREKMDKK